MRKTLPLLVTGIAGAILLLEFFFKIPVLTGATTKLMNWNIIVAAFATALGAANLYRIHVGKINSKKENWRLSILLLVTMSIFIVLGVVDKPSGPTYKFFWDNLLQPLSATLFSANAFFITSAAYRAFRIKTGEAAVLMFAALFVMLGNIGVGRAISPYLPVFGSWLMRVPNAASMRGITIGAALGSIAISLRVLLGMERSHFGAE